MLEYEVISKDTIYTKYDYILEDIKILKKLLPYLTKKIKGEWKIYLIKFKLSEIEFLKTEYKYIKFIVMLSKEDMEQVKGDIKKISTWDSYLEYLSMVNKNMSNKTISELYRRSKGNLATIIETIQSLEVLYPNSQNITIAQLDKILIKEDIVYARDVVLAMLLKKNKLLSTKGSIYSKYKFSNYLNLYLKLRDIMNADVAFYAIKKQIKKLYDIKMSDLNNEDIDKRKVELCKYIDIYEILYLHTIINLLNYNQIYILFVLWDKRGKFKIREELKYYDICR